MTKRDSDLKTKKNNFMNVDLQDTEHKDNNSMQMIKNTVDV